MAVDAARAKSLFLDASDLADPAERAAYLDRECGGDAELRARVEALLAADDRAGPFPEPERPPACRTDLTRNPGQRPRPSSRKRVGTAVRRTPATGDASGDGPRRAQGLRIADGRAETSPADRPADPSRARSSPAGTRCSKSSARGGWAPSTGPSQTATGQAAGGAQADQDRHGLARGAGPVRRRAAGAGLDGPPQHRPRLRRRHHRGRPAVLRDGAGERRADHRLLRPPAAPGPGPAGVVRRRLPGGATRPPEGDHPPRPEAQQRDGHRGRRPAHARRSSTSGSPRRRNSSSPTRAWPTPGRSSARRRTCRPSRPTRRRWTSTPGPTSMRWA